VLPRRGESVRELELPLPAPEAAVNGRRRPAGMAAWVGTRPLKRWRYVGAFGPTLMLCAGEAWIGPIPQRWWAVALPDGSLWERTTIGPGGVSIGRDSVSVASGEVLIELDIGHGDGCEPVESVHANGRRGWVWTRKQAGVPITGRVRIGGRSLTVDCSGVIDDSAGYHRRDTEWRWSAGVGRSGDGRAIGWNLVEGVNDEPAGSERTIWVEGAPTEVGPVEFAEDLSALRFGDGGELRCDEWSAREHDLNALLVRSSYSQPFGAFSGDLPGGLSLSEGWGVMEWHRVRW
jgi:hypothetical protein